MTDLQQFILSLLAQLQALYRANADLRKQNQELQELATVSQADLRDDIEKLRGLSTSDTNGEHPASTELNTLSSEALNAQHREN